jgi:hypothetical protein
MRRFNLSEPSFDYDSDDPEGFRAGLFRMGPDAGAEDTGTSLYELPPGQALCPYQPVHVLMWSNVVWPTGTAYPDSDKVGLWLAPGDSLMVRRASGVEYYDGETHPH